MLRRLNRFGDGQDGKVKLVLATGVVLALAISPFAVAQTSGLVGGKRNPARGAFSSETQVIAKNSTWGMRYSNRAVGGGGGLLFGCRSEPGGTPQKHYPCARSRNVANGLAFEFLTAGSVVGTITAGRGGDNTKPFTTNATGVSPQRSEATPTTAASAIASCFASTASRSLG